MMKWVLPLACVVTLAACSPMQQGRSSTSGTSSGATSPSSSSMGSGTYSSGSSSGASGSGVSSGSMPSGGMVTPQTVPAPGEAGAKAKGADPSVPEPTTSGTTQK